LHFRREGRIKRDPKEKTKNTLSAQTPALRDYLANVKPFGKRESERRAFEGIRLDYSEEQIGACLERLQAKGLPGSGATCHSPMGFLSKAMGQILAEVEQERGTRVRAAEQARLDAEERGRRLAAEIAVDRELELREQAFTRAYPDAEDQVQVIFRYGARFPMIPREGPALRSLAIGAWWAENEGANVYV
jgi:hypothetical protein